MNEIDMSDVSSLRIEGELTIYRAAELCETLKAALNGLGAGGRLEIDLSAVSEMDSAGAQLLIAARRTATETQRELRLVDPSAPVLEVLDILQLADWFADADASTV